MLEPTSISKLLAMAIYFRILMESGGELRWRRDVDLLTKLFPWAEKLFYTLLHGTKGNGKLNLLESKIPLTRLMHELRYYFESPFPPQTSKQES